jgi:hypothetical protein
MYFQAVILSLAQGCALRWDKNGETLVKYPGSDSGDCGSQLQQGDGGGARISAVGQPAETAPWK